MNSLTSCNPAGEKKVELILGPNPDLTANRDSKTEQIRYLKISYRQISKKSSQKIKKRKKKEEDSSKLASLSFITRDLQLHWCYYVL